MIKNDLIENTLDESKKSKFVVNIECLYNIKEDKNTKNYIVWQCAHICESEQLLFHYMRI
jgi:hypothetical protein